MYLCSTSSHTNGIIDILRVDCRISKLTSIQKKKILTHQKWKGVTEFTFFISSKVRRNEASHKCHLSFWDRITWIQMHPGNRYRTGRKSTEKGFESQIQILPLKKDLWSKFFESRILQVKKGSEKSLPTFR